MLQYYLFENNSLLYHFLDIHTGTWYSNLVILAFYIALFTYGPYTIYHLVLFYKQLSREFKEEHGIL